MNPDCYHRHAEKNKTLRDPTQYAYANRGVYQTHLNKFDAPGQAEATSGLEIPGHTGQHHSQKRNNQTPTPTPKAKTAQEVSKVRKKATYVTGAKALRRGRVDQK